MTILLIRHGETDGNASRIIQHPETPLNANGREQANRVAAKIAKIGNIEIILSSDYCRARETAEKISEKTVAPLTYSQSLRERNFGDLRGKAYDELKDIDLFAEDYVPPRGESWVKFRERVDSAWNEIIERKSNSLGTIAVVTHGLFIRSLIERTLHIDEELSRSELIVENTSITYVTGSAPWTVKALATTNHLDTEHRASGII